MMAKTQYWKVLGIGLAIASFALFRFLLAWSASLVVLSPLAGILATVLALAFITTACAFLRWVVVDLIADGVALGIFRAKSEEAEQSRKKLSDIFAAGRS